MEIKRFFLLIIVAFLAMGLVACQRPATTAPTGEVTTETTDGGFPLPEETEPTIIDNLGTFATQTAMAAETGGEQPPVATEEPTSSPPEPTAETQATQAPAQPTAQSVAAAAATPTPGIPSKYTLQKGEFPYCIARRFNVNPEELLSTNGLGLNSQTYPGQTLKIPQTGRTFPGSRSLVSHPTDYKVKTGDTIYSIACAFGDVDPIYMANFNNLKEPYSLEAGKTIKVP